MRQSGLKQFALKGAVVFLVIVGVLTYFSGTIEYILLPEVTVMEPTAGKLQEDLSKEAEVVYESDSGIYSPEDITVTEVLVSRGESIEAGSPILKVNRKVLNRKRDECGLEKTKVQNELESLYYDWNHFQGTQAEKNILGNRIEEKELEYEILRKKYDSLSDHIDENGNLLSEKSGLVTKVNVRNGQTVAIGEEFMRVVEEGTGLCLNFELDETEAEYYRKDGKFELIYNDRAEDGTVVSRSAQGNMVELKETEKEEVYSVTGQIGEDASANLKYGDKVRVTLESEGIAYDSIIPVSAVKESEGRKVVYVLRQDENRDYYVKKIQAVILESSDYFVAAELELEYGDRIVTSTSKSLNDRDKVRIRT